MSQTQTLKNFSLDSLASDANKMNRGQRFAGMIFTGTGLAVILLGAFLLLTGSIPGTAPRLLLLTGIPILYFYIGFLFFTSVKSNVAADWTLAVRIQNEKEKMARQINLYKKLPTHFFLPVMLIIGLSILPGLFDPSRGDTSLTKMVFYIVSVGFIIAASVWGLKREEKTKLRPLLEKLEQLEQQLNEN